MEVENQQSNNENQTSEIEQGNSDTIKQQMETIIKDKQMESELRIKQ